MAGELTKQEQVDRARLRLQLTAEKLELESRLAARAGGPGRLSSLLGSSGLPPVAGLAGGALLAVAAGVLLARKPGLRAPALALLSRLLSR